MSNQLPTSQVIGVGRIETVKITITGDTAAPSNDHAALWAVEFVAGSDPSGSALVRYTLGSGVVFVTETPLPQWQVTLPYSDTNGALALGSWYWFFNRIDAGAGKVIARGLMIDSPVVSGSL